MMQASEVEDILRRSGIDPAAVAKFKRMGDGGHMGTEVQGVQPLDCDAAGNLPRASIINSLTNKNNVNNGYTPAGSAIGCVPEELPAPAIEEEQRINGDQGEEDDARATIMPAPFYLKVDLFDNGSHRNGKSKGNQYKVKVHLCFEDGGDVHSFLGAFHPVARGFRNNVPEGYEQHPFYTDIDCLLDEMNVKSSNWRIRPVGAKLKDGDNKVIVFTAAVVTWELGEDNPIMYLSLQGFDVAVTLDKRPTSKRPGNNLLAYGIWINPDMKTEREVFENKRGGNTLMQTIQMQKMGLK